jgi:ABC-type nitrate/sulfonate/bicarbonate transport system substrate-binding protein
MLKPLRTFSILALLGLAGCGTTAAPGPSASASSAAAAASPSQPAASPASSAPAQAKPAGSAAASPSAAASAAAKVAFSGGDPNGYPIRISQSAYGVSSVPIYAAINKGFFQEQHLLGSVVTIPSGLSSIAALTRGDTDLSNVPSESIVGAIQGLPTRAVYETWTRASWTVMGKAELKSLADLKGKTIGVTSPSTSTYLYLTTALKGAGLSMTDLKALTTPGTGDSYAQLIAGTAGASVLSPPYDAMAEQAGFHEVAFIGGALEVPGSGLGTTLSFIKDHRPQLVGVLRAMIASEQWVKTHPAEATDMFAALSGSPPDIARRSLDKVIPLLNETGEATRLGIQQAIDGQAAATGKPATLTPDDVVDYGPLHEARGRS